MCIRAEGDHEVARDQEEGPESKVTVRFDMVTLI